MNNQPEIIYDGVCNLCEGSVAFIRKRARRNIFRFVPAQDREKISHLPESIQKQVADLQTVVLVKNGHILLKSDAILEIAKSLGGLWPILTVFKIVPRHLRDWIYELIASNRYKFFGKRKSCRLL